MHTHHLDGDGSPVRDNLQKVGGQMAKAHGSRRKKKSIQGGENLTSMSKLILFYINAVFEARAMGSPHKFSIRQE